MVDTTQQPNPIHLVGQFDHPFRGAELAQLDLAGFLAEHRPVELWSTTAAHAAFRRHHGIEIRQISPFHGVYPQGGTLILGGVHFDAGMWLSLGKFRRILLICNVPNNTAVLNRVEQILQITQSLPELVYVSEVQKLSVGLAGFVHPVPMKLDAFWAMHRRYDDKPLTEIRIGRLSRDVIQKHDANDIALYQSWSARGIKVRIVGGTCLATRLFGDPNIELLPEGALSPLELLASLDVYFYRTGSTVEMFGRVIWDAMASGLPVVAQTHGGYAAWLEQGRDVWLVNSQEQAYNAVLACGEQALLRQKFGTQARETTREQYAPSAIDAWLAYYLT